MWPQQLDGACQWSERGGEGGGGSRDDADQHDLGSQSGVEGVLNDRVERKTIFQKMFYYNIKIFCTNIEIELNCSHHLSTDKSLYLIITILLKTLILKLKRHIQSQDEHHHHHHQSDEWCQLLRRMIFKSLKLSNVYRRHSRNETRTFQMFEVLLKSKTSWTCLKLWWKIFSMFTSLITIKNSTSFFFLTVTPSHLALTNWFLIVSFQGCGTIQSFSTELQSYKSCRW